MDPFLPLSKRDAHAAIAGFLYQVERTVLAWLDLASDAFLVCEAGEDIDYVRAVEEGDSVRLCEQIKLRRGVSLTLRSAEVVEALANAVATCEQNPGQEIKFRFFTNAGTGHEQGLTYPRAMSGITAWNALGEGLLSDPDREETVRAVRNAVRVGAASAFEAATGAKREHLGQLLQILDAKSDDGLIEDLISPFVFSMDNAAPDDLRAAIEERLHSHHGQPQGVVRRLADALVVKVFRVLSQAGEKRLDHALLHEVLSSSGAPMADQDLLIHLSTFIASLTDQLAGIAGDVKAIRSNTDPDQQRAIMRDTLQSLLEPFLRDVPALRASGVVERDSPPARPVVHALRVALIRDIQEKLSLGDWVSLTGTSGIGKSDLAREVFEAWGASPKLWISLNDRASDVPVHMNAQLRAWCIEAGLSPQLRELDAAGAAGTRQLMQLVSQTVGSRLLVVLDDVPDVGTDRAAFAAIEALANAVDSIGAITLITSQLQPARRLWASVAAHVDETVVPGLDTDTVALLIERAGAPASIAYQKLAATLVALTGGHPLLLGATISWLAEKRWAVSNDELMQLLSGAPVALERRETRRTILHLVGDEQTRELLDRLSLIGGRFGKEMLSAVAEVEPPVALANERLLDLRGPWIQVFPDERFEVSPLVQTTGSEFLPAEEQRRVHAAIASIYLGRDSVNVGDAFTLCVHLAQAQDWRRLAGVYVSLLSSINTAEQAQRVDWANFFFSPEQSWPGALEWNSRILIRAVQVRLRALRGESTSGYEAELESLIAEATDAPEQQAFVGYARFMSGVLRDDLNATLVAQRVMEALRALRRAAPFVREIPAGMETLFWVGMRRVRDAQDVLAYVRLLAGLIPQERAAILTPPDGEEALVNLVDLCWTREADKSETERDWVRVLSILDEIAAIGADHGLPPLEAAARRAKAIVSADYLNQLAQALEYLEAIDTVKGFPGFVLRYTRGTILLDAGRVEEAFANFHHALAGSEPREHASLGYTAYATGLQAAARTRRWTEARGWCISAIHIAQRTSRPDSLEVVELLGELAWIHWQAGARERTLGATFGALRKLAPHLEHSTARLDEVVTKVSFLLGWITPIALTGSAPEVVANGVQYPEPVSGDVIRRRTVPEWMLDAVDSPRLYQSFGMLASCLGQLTAASWAYDCASRLATEADREFAADLVEIHRTPLVAYRGQVELAVSAAMRMVKALTVLRLSSAMLTVPSEEQARIIWQTSAPESRLQSEHACVFWGMLWPIYLFLLERNATPSTADDVLARLENRLNADDVTFFYHDLWIKCLDDMRLAFRAGNAREDIIRRNDLLSNEEQVRRVLLAVAASRVADARLPEAALLQAVIFPLATESSQGLFISRAFARWIVDYWRYQITARSFALSTPALLRSEMSSGNTSDPVGSAARILLAAVAATGARIDSTTRSELRKLSNIV